VDVRKPALLRAGKIKKNRPRFFRERFLVETIPAHGRIGLYASGAAEAHAGFAVLDYDRHFSLSARMLEHLAELGRVRLDVVVLSIRMGRPGLVRVRSAGLAVDDHLGHMVLL
jgi:hypothetical protein